MNENTLTALNNPPTSLASLPVELVTLVLDLATRASREKLHELMVVCKAFAGPAVLLLHRHVSLQTSERAAGFLEAIKRAPSPTRLASSTKRLSLSFSPISSPQEGAITTALALPILYLLDNLQYLELDAGDDGLKALRQAFNHGGGGMSGLRGLKTSKVRWDKLVDMLESSKKLKKLDIHGLYQADPSGEDAAAVDAAGTPAGDVEPAENGAADGGNVTPAAATSDVTDDPTGQDPAPFRFPSFSRPPSPTLATSHPLTPFPSLPLTHLTLRHPDIPDELFLSILAATHDTLSCLALVEAACFSRAALVVALKAIPNLLELDISGCRFPRAEQPPPATLPINSPPNTLTPLPSLVPAPPSLLSSPLPSRFSPDPAYLSPAEVATPLDHLPRFTAFLHVLTLASDDLLSTDGGGRANDSLSHVMALLPLQSLTLDIVSPRLGVDEVVNGVRRAEGRLEAVAVGKRMRWTTAMLEEGRKRCANYGVVLSGDAVEVHRRA